MKKYLVDATATSVESLRVVVEANGEEEAIKFAKKRILSIENIDPWAKLEITKIREFDPFEEKGKKE
jgi:hypothetical protein